MNFIFDSCFFGTNNIYIQNNNTFLLPERIPFNDVTQKMKNFFNIQKNKQFNTFSKNFNDNSNEEKEFQFLKKKSCGDMMNNFKDNEENNESQESISKSSKHLNNLYKKQNSIINNLDENEDEEDKENLSFLNKNGESDNEAIDINQILSDTIKEKKESDKYEREKKKIDKMKKLKILLKNRKNSLDYTYNGKDEGENKENININIFKNFGCFGAPKKDKEINLMNID